MREMEKYVPIFVDKLQGKRRPLGRLMYRYEYKITGGVDWMKLGLNKVLWRDFVRTMMKQWFSKKEEAFLEQVDNCQCAIISLCCYNKGIPNNIPVSLITTPKALAGVVSIASFSGRFF
jgi:hypothetical protein